MKRYLVALGLFALLATGLSAQETRRFIDDIGRSVEIPAEPRRVVSLHDQSITIPLLELGVVPVGSHGRTMEDGTPYIRSARMLTGADFDNTNIAFMGNFPADVEAVAAAEPDLIITVDAQSDILAQLETIAPTIVLDNGARADYGLYSTLADLTGTQDRLDRLEARYAHQIAELRHLVDAEAITVNVIQASGGELAVWHSYFNLGRVLRDAGFAFPAIVDAIPEGENARWTGEVLPELDADFIFVTYPAEAGQTPTDARAALDAVVPGFCEFLHACRANQLVAIPRDQASSWSYYALGQMTYAIISQVSGRGFEPRS